MDLGSSATGPPGEGRGPGARGGRHHPLRRRLGGITLPLPGTVPTFGTAVDIILAELGLEAFYPADAATARALAAGQAELTPTRSSPAASR